MAKKKASERAADAAPGSTKVPPKEVDLVKAFSDKLREHKEYESRWAVLLEARVEYFRGKDFVELLNKFPDLKNPLKDERPADDTPEAIANLLLKRKLILRCSRVTKNVRHGKKKLSKWPARIELFRDQVFSEDDAFFCMDLRETAASMANNLVLLIPNRYFGLLSISSFSSMVQTGGPLLLPRVPFLIFGLLFVRLAIFGLMWIIFGKRIWFFPNILAEDATISELFTFWPEKSKEEDTPPKKTTRLAFAMLLTASIWVVLHHGPDEAARSRYQKKVSNIIDEVLVWKPNLAALTGNSNSEKVTVINETLQADIEPGEDAPEDVPAESTDMPDDLIENSSLQEPGGEGADDVTSDRNPHSDL